MPEKRLRALVSLYHQSSSWLTPENLDYYIDLVFTPSMNSPNGVTILTNRVLERTKEDLENILKARMSAPKFGGIDSHFSTNPNYTTYISFIDARSDKTRKAEINATLYGYDVSFKPGVESVRDALKEQASVQNSANHSSDDS